MMGAAAMSSPASATGCARSNTIPADRQRSFSGTPASVLRASSIRPASAQQPAPKPAPSHPDGYGLRTMNCATSTGLQYGFALANQDRGERTPPAAATVVAALVGSTERSGLQTEERTVIATAAIAISANRARTGRSEG